MTRQYDYTWAILGVVGFVALAAVLLILKPGFDIPGNKAGAATLLPSDNGPDETPAYVDYEGVLQFSESETVIIEGIEYTISAIDFKDEGVQLTINDRPSVVLAPGSGILLNNRDYLQIAYITEDPGVFVVYYIYDRWFAPQCAGLTSQTATSGPDAACCGGVLTSLPNCAIETAEPPEVVCGERIITCENNTRVSRYEATQ